MARADYLCAVASRDEIVGFLDDLLAIREWDDYGPNGLQVPGAEEVGVVATGVSAHRELFERAAAAGAQLVVCHHGLFWGGAPQAITPAMKGRLKALFDADLSLAAYHLPLDAHPEVGNNALICGRLGLDRGEPFGDAKGRPIGFVGRADGGISFDELWERCRAAFTLRGEGWETEPLVYSEGPPTVRSVGVVSGGGARMLAEAASAGLDALLTGEPSEPAMAEARESGIHFIAAGHYATETFGVRRLGELVAGRFGVEHRFIDVPNPV
jgi:dinuclear metal center YbgI/SA1388 family protein